MNVRVILAAILCYLIWGCQTLYWNILSDFSSAFILVVRIVMSFLVTLMFLCATGKIGEIVFLLRDKEKMKFILPASLIIAADWAVFIWAIGHGHVIDCNIGYYLNPLVLFLFGLFLFKEKANKFEVASIGIAFLGVVVFVVMAGQLPLLALVCASLFPIYGLLKKYANTDPIASIAVETMILSPIMIAYMLLFEGGDGGLGSATIACIPLFIGCGVITALPMIMYTSIVNRLPMKFIGIIQYMGTTISTVCGVVFLHEDMTLPKLMLLIFIIVGIVVFTIGSFKKQKLQSKSEEVI